ncbi:MAG: thioredoxin family protein [Bacilli bacterium]
MKKEENKRILGIIIITIIVVIIGVISSLGNKPNNDGNNNVENKEEDEELILFKNIDLDQFVDIFNGDKLSIIYIASPSCGYCQQFQPILEKIAKKYDLLINYLNISDLDTAEKQQEYVSVHGYLSAYGFSTPTILIVKQGAIYDINPGYVEEETLKEFFIRNSFIKEE